MKKGFMGKLADLIKESDIVLEILDARFPEKTRNHQVERTILGKGKALVLVINKADLVSKEKIALEKKNLIKDVKMRVVFVSAKEKNGIRLLKREISMASPKGKREVTVGMLGYPNSGKSTLINSLSGKGKGKVRTSSKAGFTRGLQRIKIADGLYLLDAPGIIPYDERDEFELFILGAKNANQLKEMETVAMKLVAEFGIDEIARKFGIENFDGDEEDLMEDIALKRKWLMSGGKGNVQKAAREILEMYQRNEL